MMCFRKFSNQTGRIFFIGFFLSGVVSLPLGLFSWCNPGAFNDSNLLLQFLDVIIRPLFLIHIGTVTLLMGCIGWTAIGEEKDW